MTNSPRIFAKCPKCGGISGLVQDAAWKMHQGAIRVPFSCGPCELTWYWEQTEWVRTDGSQPMPSPLETTEPAPEATDITYLEPSTPMLDLSPPSYQPYEAEVWCTWEFEGFHCWPSAPEAVVFLQHRHRHIFKCRAVARVAHNDRDVEFILLKQELEGYCRRWADSEERQSWSCEMWAVDMLDEFILLHEVTVSEDGENGATVRRR